MVILGEAKTGVGSILRGYYENIRTWELSVKEFREQEGRKQW